MVCAKCGLNRDDRNFYVDVSRTSRLDTTCKPCRREARRVRYATNFNGVRERMAASYARNKPEFKQAQFVYRLKRVYNITPEQHLAILQDQGEVCALCFEAESKIHHNSNAVMRLSIDHDHACCPTNSSCGRCIRGLLCYECNLLVGKVEMKPELAKRFQDYLVRRPFA